MTQKGIDVSNYQPRIDWKRVSESGIEVVHVLATDGIRFKNPLYSKQMHGADSQGMSIGAYHFFRPQYTGREQAEWFLKSAGWVASWLLPVLDIEHVPSFDNFQSSAILARAREWLDFVGERVGAPPFIYTNRRTWSEALGDPTTFHQYPLWVAQFGPNDGRPHPPVRTPGKWPSVAGWQYTSRGLVDGITLASGSLQHVDRSEWYDLGVRA